MRNKTQAIQKRLCKRFFMFFPWQVTLLSGKARGVKATLKRAANEYLPPGTQRIDIKYLLTGPAAERSNTLSFFDFAGSSKADPNSNRVLRPDNPA
jgi:hypothetical protein